MLKTKCSQREECPKRHKFSVICPAVQPWFKLRSQDGKGNGKNYRT